MFHWYSNGSKFVTTQTTQIVLGHVFLTTASNTYTSMNKTKIIGLEMELFSFFFTLGRCAQFLHASFDAMLLPVSALKLFPNFMEGADSMILIGSISVDRCHFNSVTMKLWQSLGEGCWNVQNISTIQHH